MSTIGRTVGVLRAGAQILRGGTQQISVRKAGGGSHSKAYYREPTPVPKKLMFKAELLSGAMWFWIMWHFWHSSDDVLGHFPWPNTSEWTDEELGIPPDDADDE